MSRHARITRAGDRIETLKQLAAVPAFVLIAVAAAVVLSAAGALSFLAWLEIWTGVRR